MALIANKSVPVFDPEEIKRGDAIRIRHAGDSVFKNGFVTKTGDNQIEIQYCNTQNTATSFLQILAVDVSVGVWEIYWTTDFASIKYQPAADVVAGGGTGG